MAGLGYLDSFQKFADEREQRDAERAGTGTGHDFVNYDQHDFRARDATRDRLGLGGREDGAAHFGARAQLRAEESGRRAAYGGDPALQGYQTGALDALSGAAAGTAPSQAAILAKAQSDAAVDSAQSAAGSVKGGPGARVAAMRAAMGGQAMQQQAGAREAAAARAGEMAQARGQYAQASGAALASNQMNEARQRQLNDAREAGYEQLGFNNMKQGQDNQLAQEQLAQQKWVQGRQATTDDEKTTWGKVKDAVSMGAGVVSSIGGMFASDERAKIKLDDAMQASFDGRGEDPSVQYGYFSDPYSKGAPEPGALGAPKGYAASRAGQDGYMFGGESAPSGEQMAPGTADWQRYGAGGESAQHAVMGQPGGQAANSSGFGQRLAMAANGFRNTFTSDERAKREAYELGRTHANAQADAMPDAKQRHDYEGRKRDERWNIYRQDALEAAAAKKDGKAAPKLKDVDPIAAESSDAVISTKDYTPEKFARVQAAKELGMKRRQADIQAGNTDGGEAEYRARFGLDGPAPAVESPKPAEGGGLSDYIQSAKAYLGFRADGGPVEAGRPYVVGERGPELVVPDSDGYVVPNGSDATHMRDGSSDPRTNSFDKTFHRDTPADRKRIKRGVEDKAGKDADELMASFKARSNGPSAVNEALARANRSMAPELYVYRPEFTPPGQEPGEVNVGPIAQRMAGDRTASTAVVQDPTGLLQIDKDKALRLTMGSIASLQAQLDELRGRNA